MTTKHKPATALPWKSELEIVNCNSDHPQGMAADFGKSSKSFKGDIQNAEYATHTANAYPRLVEALRRILNNPDASIGGHVRAETVGLLRELGED